MRPGNYIYYHRRHLDGFDFGMGGLERCFHCVLKPVARIVHICCGYPDHLDDVNYKKADLFLPSAK